MGEVIELGQEAPLDRASLVQAVYEFLEANMPGGWTPHTGNLDDLIVNAESQQVSELAALLTTFGLTLFRYYGLKVQRVEPVDALPAEGLTTWTAPDAAGHLIPAGTELSIDDVAFATVEDAEIPAEASSVNNVKVLAQEPGTFANTLTGTPIVRDNLAVEYTVELQAATSKGQDAESDSEYLARLVEELKLFARSLITPEDFARAARLVAGVGRVLPLNLHNAENEKDEEPGHITIAPTNDTDGKAASAETKAALEALYGVRRVLPITTHVIDPTYHAIAIEAKLIFWPGYEPATVIAQAEDLLDAFLDPSTYGSPQQGEEEAWTNTPQITLYQIAGALERAAGVQRATDIKINGKAEDLTMAGTAPLPEPGAYTLTTEAA